MLLLWEVLCLEIAQIVSRLCCKDFRVAITRPSAAGQAPVPTTPVTPTARIQLFDVFATLPSFELPEKLTADLVKEQCTVGSKPQSITESADEPYKRGRFIPTIGAEKLDAIDTLAKVNLRLDYDILMPHCMECKLWGDL
jgi:hypothetical protein